MDKYTFARAIFDGPENHLNAILPLVGGDTSAASYYLNEFINDPEVIAELARLNEMKKDPIAQMKRDASQLAWNIATNGRIKPKERIDALRLYCDMHGLIAEKGKSNKDLIELFNVMEVPTHGNDEDWEKRLLAQQKALVNEN